MSLGKDLNPPVILFYSYSHKDETYREELVKHLIMLQRSGLIREWHDRKILPGEEWDEQISINLENADLILLLISSDFLASKYCYDIEAKRALERHNNGEAILIPIILRPVTWNLTPFSKIQSLPFNAQPVTQWLDKDLAYVSVCEGILALITSFKPESKEVNTNSTAVSLLTKPTPESISKLSRPKVLDAALPEQAEIGKTIVLVVMIRSEDSEGLKKILRINTQYGVGEEDVVSTGAFSLEFSVDEAGKALPLELNIKIESPDFEQPKQTKSLRILPDGDSEPRIFLLTPKTLGDLIVNLELYNGDDFISGCFLRTKALQTQPQNISTNLVTVPINHNYSANLDIHTTNEPISIALTCSPPPPQSNSYSPPSQSQSSSYNFPPSQSSTVLPKYMPNKNSPPVLSAVKIKRMKHFSLLGTGMVAVFSIFFILAGAGFIVLNRMSHRAANNSGVAISSLRTIQGAQAVYLSVNNSNNDSKKFGTLEQLKNAGLIDETLASGERSGYQFTVTTSTLNNKPAFDITAKPINSENGERSFYTNEQGEIYYSEGNKLGSRANPGIRLN